MRGGLLLAWLLFVPCLGLGQTITMVVHLPESPLESVSQLGDGVTMLARYIESSTPGLSLEVKAFRKSEDAKAFMLEQGESVALVVSDVAFVSDLPSGFDAVPSFRFVRGGQETRRKLVVVKTTSDIGSLAELRGRSITVAQASGTGSKRYLAEVVFREEIDPESWFSSIAYESDDFTATAAVLYDRTDAALVSEDNPLLVSQLGKELVEIYASAPVSLSVVSFRGSVLTDAQVSSISRALSELGARADAAPILAELKIDGFRRLANPAVLTVGSSSGSQRALEVAVPAFLPVGPPGLSPLGPEAVPFLVGVELAEVPIPSELVDAVLEHTQQ